MVWFSFAVELGDQTLAEHVDTISATPEAKHLLDGTRETINPAIEDVRDRMLGEYVEAPTWIGQGEGEIVPASSSAPEPERPGRRRVRREPESESVPEPARPGRRLRPNVLGGEPAHERPEPPAPIAEPPPSPAPAAPTLPWRRAPIDDRSVLAPMFELAQRIPAPPEPTLVPIVHPVIDPELPELPGER